MVTVPAGVEPATDEALELCSAAGPRQGHDLIRPAGQVVDEPEAKEVVLGGFCFGEGVPCQASEPLPLCDQGMRVGARVNTILTPARRSARAAAKVPASA